MTAEERLRFHQQHNQPNLNALHDWMETQFAERKVEPNSSLGKAITNHCFCSKLARPWTTTFAKEP